MSTEAYSQTNEMLGYAPEECYVFEDGVNGARTDIAAGCATIMILDSFPQKDLRINYVGIFQPLGSTIQDRS